MDRLVEAVKIMHAMPTWCILVDADRKIIDANKIAYDNGARRGVYCYSAIAERRELCPWCENLDKVLSSTSLVSCLVELGYREGDGFIVEKGGMIRDAHWLGVDEKHFLHFGFLGLCSFDDQQKALALIGGFIGGGSPLEASLAAIEATSKQFFG